MTTRTVAAPIALLAPEGDAAPRVVGFALDAPALAPLPAEALSPFVSSMREWIMDRYPGILSVRNDFGRGRSFWLLADAEAAPDPDELLYHMRAGILLGTWKLPDVREAVRLALAPGAAAMRTTEVAPSDLWPNDRMACAAAIASRRLHTMRLPGVGGGTLHPIPISTAKGPSQELWLWPPRTIGDGNDARLLVGRVGLKATDSLVPGRIAVVAELRVSTIIDRPVAWPAGIGSLHWLAKDAQERLRSIKLHLAPDGETIVDTRVRMLRGVYNGFAVPDFKEFRKDPAAHLDVLKASGLFATASATTQYVTAYTDDGPVGHRTGAVKLKGVTAGEESLLLHALAAHLAPLGFSRCPPSADVAAARLKPLAKLPEPPDSVAPDVQLRTKLPDGFAVCVAHDTLDGEDASRCGPLLEDLRSAVADWSLRVYGTADAIRFVPAPVPGIAEPMPSKSGRADQEAFVSVMREAVEDCLRGVNLPAAIIAMCPFRKVGSSRKEWVRRAAGFGAARPLQCVDPVAYNKPPPVPRGSGQIATKLRARMPRMTAADFAQFKEEVGEYQPERLADLAEEFRAEAHLQRKAHVRAAVLWEVSRQLGVRPALPHPSLMPHDALVVVQVSGVRSGQRSHSREGGAVALAVRWRRGTTGTDLSTPALSAWRDVHERGIGTISGDESNAKILAWLAALARSPDTKGHLFVLTVADQYLSSRAEQALAGRDIAVVDTSGIRMVGAKPGLLEAGLGYEAYRAAEQDHVRRLCPAGLYPQGGGAFLSVTEAKSQDQGLAKGSATRFLVRLPGLKPVSGAAPKAGGKKPPEARMLRPKGYLIRVSLTGEGDAEAVAAALHGMRRMDIPGGGSNFVSPGGVHYARKLLEWAGYEDKDRPEGLDNEQDKARPGGYLFVGGASE